jgi:DNA-binding NarL/FixJ family response regulator
MALDVLIADDHSLMREGIEAILSKEEGFNVVAHARNGHEAVRLAEKHGPAIVIMDLNMPEMNGFEALNEISTRRPEIKLLALSMHSDRRFIARALKEGANGYLLKDCASGELISAIRTLMEGGTYLSPGIAGLIVKDYVSSNAYEVSLAEKTLTTREREILQLLAEGKSIKETSEILNISPKTVETHKGSMIRKLGINTIAELTKFAIREGITDLD